MSALTVAACILGIVIGAVWHAYATHLDRINRDAEAADQVARAAERAL